jgi:O-antigen/teichoic acid export membrane protein
MQRTFLVNLILLVVVNLLVKPLAIFGIDARVQNEVGTEAYGLYFSLLNLSFLFNMLMDLGMNNLTTKEVAQNPTKASENAGKLIGLRVLLFFVYALFTLLVGFIIGYKGNQLYLLGVLVFNQLLVTLIAYCRSHLGGLHLFKQDALISVLDRCILILWVGYLLFFNPAKRPFQMEWFIYIQTAGYLITLLVALALVLFKIGKLSIRWKRPFMLATLKKSLPYALLVFLMMAYTRTDTVMLERLHPKGNFEAGVYAQGYRLLDACYMFAMIFANLLFPIFSRLLKHEPNAVGGMLRLGRNLLLGGSLLIAFISFGHSNYLLSLIYDSDLEYSVKVFPWLMGAFVGMSLTLTYGTLLTAAGHLTFLNSLSALAIILSVGLNFLLIPQFGATGAAWTACITQVLVGIAQWAYCHRTFPVHKGTTDGVGFLLLIVCQIGLLFLPFPEAIAIVISLVVGVFTLFLFRLVSLKSFFSLQGLTKR